MKIEKILFPRWLVPVEPEYQVLEDYAVVVDAGKIVELLPANQARAKYTASEQHELEQHVLLPGFINAHTHAAMSIFRGMADDLPLMTWLNDHIWPAEHQWIDRDFVRDGSRLAIAEMIRSGTTCFADMYFFGDETATAAEAAGLRAVIGLIVIDFPSAWAKDSREYLEKAKQLHHSLGDSKLVKTAFSPHSPYAVSESALIELNKLSSELDIPIMMHVHETADEVKQSLEQYKKRPIQRLDDLGLLGPRLMAVHMTQLSNEEIELLHAREVHVVHCPESNMKLASGFCPVQSLLDSKINIALGTDGAASNNDLDMLGEMRSAALIGKAVAQDATALNAFEVIKMATLNGAKALQLDSVTGSLVIGKQADFVAINLDEIETLPLRDPVSQIVYSATRNQVSDVWVSGQHLMREGELLTVDEAAIRECAKNWGNKLYS